MNLSGSAELSTLVKHIHACKVTCVKTEPILNNQARHSSGSSHKNMQHEPLPTDVIRERMPTEGALRNKITVHPVTWTRLEPLLCRYKLSQMIILSSASLPSQYHAVWWRWIWQGKPPVVGSSTDTSKGDKQEHLSIQPIKQQRSVQPSWQWDDNSTYQSSVLCLSNNSSNVMVSAVSSCPRIPSSRSCHHRKSAHRCLHGSWS